MRAPVNVCDQQINAIVDSGVEVTVMSKDLYYRLPKEQCPKLTKAEKGLVVAEEEHIMPTDR